MSNLIAVTFEDETAAFSLRAALARLQREFLIAMEDVVVVTRDEAGKVRLHQAAILTDAGAPGGAFWGRLIGMILLEPRPGEALGAAADAVSGHLTDLGLDDGFMTELGEGLPDGGSALFVLVRKSTPDKVLASLDPFRGRGKVLRASVSKENDQDLRDYLEEHPA